MNPSTRSRRCHSHPSRLAPAPAAISLEGLEHLQFTDVLVFGGSTATTLSKVCPELSILIGGRNREKGAKPDHQSVFVEIDTRNTTRLKEALHAHSGISKDEQTRDCCKSCGYTYLLYILPEYVSTMHAYFLLLTFALLEEFVLVFPFSMHVAKMAKRSYAISDSSSGCQTEWNQVVPVTTSLGSPRTYCPQRSLGVWKGPSSTPYMTRMQISVQRRMENNFCVETFYDT